MVGASAAALSAVMLERAEERASTVPGDLARHVLDRTRAYQVRYDNQGRVKTAQVVPPTHISKPAGSPGATPSPDAEQEHIGGAVEFVTAL